MADAIGAPIMQHLYQGHVAGRSGEIMLVPQPYNFLIGEWDLTTLGTDQPTMSTSHPNPWDYLTRVPIIAYGDGLAPSGVEVERETDIAALAPTYARLLGMSDFGAEGEALDEIEVGKPRPKVIFTVVIDGGGWNALQEHPSSWPNIRAFGNRALPM
jgi:hypothetical protein